MFLYLAWCEVKIASVQNSAKLVMCVDGGSIIENICLVYSWTHMLELDKLSTGFVSEIIVSFKMKFKR